MSLSIIRTVAAAAALALAPLATAHAQEAFVPADPGVGSGAEAPAGAVLRVEADAAHGSMYRHLASSRASWLASRGPYEQPLRSHVVVYLNGTRVGGVDALRKITAADVEKVERLDPREASRRFGLDHGAGALLLTSR